MSRARPVLLLVALLITTLAVRARAQPAGQSASAPKAIIIGQVVDGSSGQAIPSAIVTLDRSTRVMTTSDGRFVFRNLDPGNYGLSATKSGYVSTEFGAQRPNGGSRSVIIAEGQRRRDVVIRLWRHAAITGTVVDEAGEPVIGVNVTALRRTAVGGRVKFVMEGYSTPTDDRGMYRIARLAPGAYVVLVRTDHVTLPALTLEQGKDSFIQAILGRGLDAGMRLQQSLVAINGFMGLDGSGFQTRRIGDHVQMMAPEMPTPPPADSLPLLGYQTMYYANAVSVRAASLLTVTAGQERSGVNLQISPVPMVRVSGTLSAPQGDPAYLPMRLMAVDSHNVDGGQINTMTDGNGRFTFLSVPSGDYTLRVVETPPAFSFFGDFTIADTNGAEISGKTPLTREARSTLWASTPLSVGNTDVSDLAISLKNGFTISGHVEFDGAERPTAEQMSEAGISIQPVDTEWEGLQLPSAKLDKSDHFTTVALPPGRYLLHVLAGGARWSLKSASASDRDVSGIPIEIESRNISNVVFKLTDRPAALSGAVQARDEAARRGAFVVIFPTDAEAWIDNDFVSERIRRAPTDDNGHYEFHAVFPGDYYLAAIPENASSDWQDPALLQQLVPSAVHVQVGEGEKVSRDLRLQELR
jgi:Carboxypeptidase regulatory-like domain